ncbi:flavin reductase (NADPH) [Acrasis kona]|uniref:Flavin reductase (NADPH) n=1 Tax=Acrasis kona TaxID=1008807 RepID=A0AAW2Z2B9_9EUKA
MRVAFFGCTGATGVFILPQLLSLGYDVSVLVRDKKKLGDLTNNSSLYITEGSPRDENTVRTVINGSDIVLSTLGNAGYGSESDGLMYASIKNIVSGMRDSKVKKLVLMEGIFVGQPTDSYTAQTLFKPFLYFYSPWRDAMNLSNFVNSDDVKNSIDWIIIRPPFLTNEIIDDKDVPTRYTHYRDCLRLAVTYKVSRQCVAHFLVEIVKQASGRDIGDFDIWSTYKHFAPTIVQN